MRIPYLAKCHVHVLHTSLLFLIWIGRHLTESSDELALMQKRDCEVDLKRMGCSGITSTCDFIGSIATCNCHATNCSTTMDYELTHDRNPSSHNFVTSPNSKVGVEKFSFSFHRTFLNFLNVLNRQFRLRYGIEGIGSKDGFLRLGFCKIPVPAKRNDVCFFMHWFFANGFKQLNVRFGHRVTNSSSASV